MAEGDAKKVKLSVFRSKLEIIKHNGGLLKNRDKHLNIVKPIFSATTKKKILWGKMGSNKND